MDNDLIVITAASRVAGTMTEYLDQLHQAEIDVWVEDLSQQSLSGAGGNLGYKLKMMRDFANRFHNYSHIVMTDAWDVTFYGTKEQVIAKIPLALPLWGAEKNCYPDPHLKDWIGGTTPWRFANGGLLAGTPSSISYWCDEAERHHLYDSLILDQQFLNRVLAEQTKEFMRSPFVLIDSKTELFFCLHSGYEELDWENGKPVNTLTSTRPAWVHANGKWPADEAFRKRDESCTTSQPSAR